MKYEFIDCYKGVEYVAPFVGVWIEIERRMKMATKTTVAPFVGVWIEIIAEAHNVPVAQVSINWSTQKSFVGTALTGVNTPAQADENCSAFEWQLNNEEIALIDSEIDRLNIG